MKKNANSLSNTALSTTSNQLHVSAIYSHHQAEYTTISIAFCVSFFLLVVLYSVSWWPYAAETCSGLLVIDKVVLDCAFAFFFQLHVYLNTTGMPCRTIMKKFVLPMKWHYYVHWCATSWTARGSNSYRGKRCFSFPKVYTGSGAHPASYTVRLLSFRTDCAERILRAPSGGHPQKHVGASLDTLCA